MTMLTTQDNITESHDSVKSLFSWNKEVTLQSLSVQVEWAYILDPLAKWSDNTFNPHKNGPFRAPM